MPDRTHLDMMPLGKLKISRSARPGEPVSDEFPAFCVVTFLESEEDAWVRKNYGVAGLRRHKLLRIATEAHEQRVTLSQEVLSFDILGCGLRTLQRDIALFASRGVFVPFQKAPQRKRQSGYLYQAAAAKMFLDDVPRLEISTRLYLQPEATNHYIREFARFAKWVSSGLSANQIKTVSTHSDTLIEEYLKLFQAYHTPDLFKSLDILTRSAS